MFCCLLIKSSLSNLVGWGSNDIKTCWRNSWKLSWDNLLPEDGDVWCLTITGWGRGGSERLECYRRVQARNIQKTKKFLYDANYTKLILLSFGAFNCHLRLIFSKCGADILVTEIWFWNKNINCRKYLFIMCGGMTYIVWHCHSAE